MPDTSPTLGLPYLAPAQAQKHVTVNEALKRLDVLAQLAVEAFDATTPPASPADGQVWALGPSPTGAWAGRDGQLAAWLDGGWEFIAPQAGWRAYGRADQSLRSHDGSGWLAVQGAAPNLTNLSELGVNAAPDATNRLAVGAAGSLFTHDGGDHRMVLNKAAAADTGSILWQTGFSGRAEIGLAGNDALSLKVSPDGTAWTTALSLSGTGAAAFADDITAGGALSVTGDIDTGGAVSAAGSLTADGALFTGTASQQVAVNKAAAADTGSVLFQTGFSGRAEIGLTGSDDLAVKVSADGSSWTDLLRLQTATGAVSIGPVAETQGTLSVADTSQEPTILIRNAGGPSGAAFRLIDDASGADWKFKSTNDGSFKLRDQSGGADYLYLQKGTFLTRFGGPMRPGVYTVATLPAPAGLPAGAMIYVEDEAGGPVPAFSDGVDWRRITDRAVVS